MTGTFEHIFSKRYPKTPEQQSWGKFQGQPPLGDIVDQALSEISEGEQFRRLPEWNQGILLSMACFMIDKANDIYHADWRGNYWGLYIVGSRARGDATPDSDLDLLSVGTFYRDLEFRDRYDDEDDVFDRCDVVRPDELPDEYNVGEVDRKYLIRAVPRVEGALPIDLSIVDLTFTDDTLDDFKDTLDVDSNGEPLPRLPLVELIIPNQLELKP